ncbi:HPr kinase/phosphatase C-terminal domain-containing protein [Sphingomonas naphthae]|uniref:HPr kinase/phosphatase C-terminal domain-containing protein n=1 Tax=Sphingomonas naphthae TaxID=1813468 RepID=A0ABY7TGJ7_9SPHN|nr:HPr kinase/phosphatase C-terminal domain-containing protein [Sphingomonas naphthae]WCT71951.1 HPr kinase/phosphatase C-terminal domain-containing protein [Sphingomonas naphthae]
MAAGLTIHATCVAIDGRAVLLIGPSGSGKSDLALRLIDRGAKLVADDRTILDPVAGELRASVPATIAGQIEVRGVGIVAATPVTAPVALAVRLDAMPERMPPEVLPLTDYAGLGVPTLALDGFEASAPLKVELALKALPR